MSAELTMEWLFEPEPPQPCALADLALWREMAMGFLGDPMPASESALRAGVAVAFEGATGRALGEDCQLGVEAPRRARRHITQASNGWWHKVAMPLLTKRLEPFTWTFEQAKRLDKIWGAEGGQGPRPTALWHAVRRTLPDAKASLYPDDKLSSHADDSVHLESLLRVLMECAKGQIPPPRWAAEPAGKLLDRIVWGEYDKEDLSHPFQLGSKLDERTRVGFSKNEEALDWIRELISQGMPVLRAVQVAGARYCITGTKDSALDKRRRADMKQHPFLYERRESADGFATRVKLALIDLDTPDGDRLPHDPWSLVARRYKLTVPEVGEALRSRREAKLLSSPLHSEGGETSG
jgi:hypothetical protein